MNSYRDTPARWENDKVAESGSLLRRRTREHREDGWVGVVKRNRVDHHELGQVIPESTQANTQHREDRGNGTGTHIASL